MKIELVEVTNHVKYGNYFEVRKDDTCVGTFFYGDTRAATREKALTESTDLYNKIKSGKTEEETIILSEVV